LQICNVAFLILFGSYFGHQKNACMTHLTCRYTGSTMQANLIIFSIFGMVPKIVQDRKWWPMAILTVVSILVAVPLLLKQVLTSSNIEEVMNLCTFQ